MAAAAAEAYAGEFRRLPAASGLRALEASHVEERLQDVDPACRRTIGMPLRGSDRPRVDRTARHDTTRLRREKRERPNQWPSRSATVFLSNVRIRSTALTGLRRRFLKQRPKCVMSENPHPSAISAMVRWTWLGASRANRQCESRRDRMSGAARNPVRQEASVSLASTTERICPSNKVANEAVANPGGLTHTGAKLG
jgi:hypothetical protein